MGQDSIPVESLGEEGVCNVVGLLQKIFEQEKMSEEWSDSVILYQSSKGRDTSSILILLYRDIKMISIQW